MAGRRTAIYVVALVFALTACGAPARSLTRVPAKPPPGPSTVVALPAPPPPCEPAVRACVSLTPMPYSVFFAPGGIAFHEGSLTEDSHGCVRLAADAVVP